jgi:hypothetical protein
LRQGGRSRVDRTLRGKRVAIKAVPDTIPNAIPTTPVIRNDARQPVSRTRKPTIGIDAAELRPMPTCQIEVAAARCSRENHCDTTLELVGKHDASPPPMTARNTSSEFIPCANPVPAEAADHSNMKAG